MLCHESKQYPNGAETVVLLYGICKRLMHSSYTRTSIVTPAVFAEHAPKRNETSQYGSSMGPCAAVVAAFEFKSKGVAILLSMSPS